MHNGEGMVVFLSNDLYRFDELSEVNSTDIEELLNSIWQENIEPDATPTRKMEVTADLSYLLTRIQTRFWEKIPT